MRLNITQEKIYFRATLGGVKTHKNLCFKKVIKTYLDGIDIKYRCNNSDTDFKLFSYETSTL